jgi:capsular exopolysaccharide synthesis family protein
MERLEQALSKARSERQNRSKLDTELLMRESAARPLLRSETKVVQLDPKLLAKNQIIANQVDHQVTDVFRSLRAQVLRRLGKNGVSTLGITSLGAGEGKTTLAINLAIAISMDINQTVLLVDGDLRTPSVAKYLGLQPTAGLADVLAERATVSECLINPGIPRLCVLPARDSIDNSAELLSSPQMLRLVHDLRTRYADRVIIFDLPPLMTVADTIGFLPILDASLLVVRDGRVQSSDLRRMMALLQEHNLIGTVLNAAA